MQPREQGQARIRQNNVQRRQIELMYEENSVETSVSLQIYILS